jgi:uncharacterized membrane protein/predicted flap endonuclease-1-like 5' DNA nuclease
MGNKNRNLIVAYFPNADAADRAGQQLKQWDKSETEIKLGGMGVIVEKDGRLETELIGSRAAGTGAKWGTILGATGGLATGVLALTGVLTGGIGLIPAAIAGLVIGTAGGALLHKKVGMSDADRDRLLAHLRNGGAALAVMADDHEVEPTKAELATLGGQVEAYAIPDAVMEEIDDVQEAADAAQADVAERFAGQSIEVQDQAAIMAAAVPALGVAGVAALHEAGVTDINTLQAKTATEAGRAELAAAAGVDAATVHKWAKDVEFARIRGVGPKYAALLKAAGIETVDDLAEANAVALARKLDDVNKTHNIVKEVPEADQVAYWIAQANEGPDVIALKTVITVTKDMLNVNAYSWTAKEGDDPRKIQMDAVMFNRKEGYEVIPMIQKVVNTFGYESVDDVKRIEEIIATELPGNVRSRKNVFNWLVEYIEAH